MTRQRRVILDVVRSASDHPTADEVYERVREVLPRVSLGTVYRNLGLLTRHGLIRELQLQGGQKRFDGDTAPHQHVQCSECGRIADASIDLPATLANPSGRIEGFRITDCRILFTGVCPDCEGAVEGPETEIEE